MTEEIIKKIKAAGSAEELARIANENGLDIPAARAEEIFNGVKSKGEISDEELENAAGGCGGKVDLCPMCKWSDVMEKISARIKSVDDGFVFDGVISRCLVCWAYYCKDPRSGKTVICWEAADGWHIGNMMR